MFGAHTMAVVDALRQSFSGLFKPRTQVYTGKETFSVTNLIRKATLADGGILMWLDLGEGDRMMVGTDYGKKDTVRLKDGSTLTFNVFQ